MEKLEKVYFSDGLDINDLPILGVGIELNGLEKQVRFQYDMYETFRKLELNLKAQPYVSLDVFRCMSCMYGLTQAELYQNMIQIRDRVKIKDGKRYTIR